MSDAMISANRALWDEWTQANESSAFYDLASFRAGRDTLRPLEAEELGDVRGKSLLHLMCHFGLDTLSLARRGARVTGCDLSEKAIELAGSLADELGLDGRFIAGDVYELPERLSERFAIVFTSWGVLAWLSDLPRWARLIEGFLEPGGVFYIAEIHPVASVLELGADGRLTLEEGYLGSRDAQLFEVESSYAARDIACTNTTSYQWDHSLAEVVTALVDAGLVIEYLREWPFSVYQRWPGMEEAGDGWWYVPGRRDVPLSFSLRAHKPVGR